MLSRFIFFIHLIDKLFEPGRGVIVTMSKSRHRIFSYYSIIIISTQRYLVYRLSEDLVFIVMITFIFLISMFPRNKHSCSLHKLYSSLLRPSKYLYTFSHLFPQTSCTCRVLLSIQQTLQRPFHQLHPSSFPRPSCYDHLGSLTRDLRGEY